MSQNDTLLDLNNDPVDDGLGADPRPRCCGGRMRMPRTKHILMIVAGFSLLLNTVMLIQLSTISYGILQARQQLPGTISGYTDSIMDQAETMIEDQIDGVVEKVGDGIKTTIYRDIDKVFIPDMMERMKGMFYNEFGSQLQFREMVEKLEKLTAYGCIKYPEACR